jgi:hypothetical protein
LAATVRRMDAVFWRSAQGDRHGQRADRQIFLQTIADRPANDTLVMQIKDDGQLDLASHLKMQ